jgi:twitching motility protein PilT
VSTHDPNELDRIVDELNASAHDRPQPSPRLEAWLTALGAQGGSDLYLVAGLPPCVRVQGQVRRWAEPVLDGEDIESQVLPALPAHARAGYRAHGHADASLRTADGTRFRVNLHRQRGRAAASIRALPTRPPRFEELGLPAGVEALARLTHGLVLIGGPTGSGKTTTVAALVDLFNRRDARHIITIEDPIEFEHRHERSVVEQVEIGIDAPDFASALRSAVRQSPDLIVIGEMRDPETMRIALAAGETGHLVLSTLHTTDVTSTISRVSDAFPPERQPTIRQELSMALGAVMTQMLVPTIGGGRIPAAELLVVGYGARQHIRKNALQHLHQEITITRRHGSFTFEESLAQLVRGGVLDVEEARARAIHRDELEGLLTGLGGMAPGAGGGPGSRITP